MNKNQINRNLQKSEIQNKSEYAKEQKNYGKQRCIRCIF